MPMKFFRAFATSKEVSLVLADSSASTVTCASVYELAVTNKHNLHSTRERERGREGGRESRREREGEREREKEGGKERDRGSGGGAWGGGERVWWWSACVRTDLS
jgi:hypothetical protein